MTGVEEVSGPLRQVGMFDLKGSHAGIREPLCPVDQLGV